MATVNFLYRSIKENEPLNVRLLFRHNNRDYTKGTKSKLYIYSHNELLENGKFSGKTYWKKLHSKKNVKDIDFKNKQIEINSELNKLENFIIKIFNEVETQEIINDKNWLKDTLYNYYNPHQVNSEIPTKLVTFFDYYIDKKRKELNITRIKNINVTKHKLQKLENTLKKQFRIIDINEEFKDVFTSFCIDNQYALNTQQRELALIKTVCRYARYLGVETHHQLDSVKIKGQETKHVHLTTEELNKIAELSLPNDYLENARDWLLISCYVGQRVSDFMRFDSGMIRIENKKHLLEFKQVKTKKLMTIPLAKEARQVLEKRNGEFPRAISHQKYNNYIKEVCKLASINELSEGKRRICIAPKGVKPTKSDYRDVEGVFEKWELVSSHIGRRSFATNYYGKIPTTFLINITGHSTEKMFLNYIKKSNKDLALESYDYFN